MIEARSIVKTYTMGKVSVHALRGVTITIPKGQFVGIMGPSGSGKSTLLHLLGLLDRPTRGEVLIDGTDAGSLSDRQRTQFRLRRLGYVFQDYALVPELTVLENVYLTSMVRREQESAYIAAARNILDRVGLGDRVDHLQGELSGGEQQRVAIARAIVNRPDILFADEPCANLDSLNSRTVLDLFSEINREMHQTIVMVSHEDWHKDYFDRIITLHDGEVVSDTLSGI